MCCQAWWYPLVLLVLGVGVKAGGPRLKGKPWVHTQLKAIVAHKHQKQSTYTVTAVFR